MWHYFQHLIFGINLKHNFEEYFSSHYYPYRMSVQLLADVKRRNPARKFYFYSSTTLNEKKNAYRNIQKKKKRSQDS